MEKRILQQIFVKTDTLYPAVISDKILLQPKGDIFLTLGIRPGEKSFSQFDLMIAFCYETGSSLQFLLESGCE